MGQQQLLLLVLGIIIVGIAIAVAINMFRQHAIVNKRDLVINECINLATQAMEYYKKSANYGGGGNSFTGWAIPRQQLVTASGSYLANVYADSVVIIGTGNEVVTGTDSVKVITTAFGNSYTTQIIH